MHFSLSHDHSLHRWFRGLVEDSFHAQIGLCDPQVADYIAELLCEFIHTDQIYALRDRAGRPIREVAEMLMQLDAPSGVGERDHRRTIHRHIGDFTLFWTGLYPEALRRRRHAEDALTDYLSQGKRSYAIASELSADDTPPPGALLRRLSEEFESCVFGLSLVRRGWEQRDPGSFGAAQAMWS